MEFTGVTDSNGYQNSIEPDDVGRFAVGLDDGNMLMVEKNESNIEVRHISDSVTVMCVSNLVCKVNEPSTGDVIQGEGLMTWLKGKLRFETDARVSWIACVG